MNDQPKENMKTRDPSSACNMTDLTIRPQKVQIFKSADPLWPKWGVAVDFKNTQWFSTKAAAEKHARRLKNDK